MNVNPIYSDTLVSANGTVQIEPNCKAIRLFPVSIDDAAGGDYIKVTFNSESPAMYIFEGQTIMTLGVIKTVEVTISGTAILDVKQLQNINVDFSGPLGR